MGGSIKMERDIIEYISSLMEEFGSRADIQGGIQKEAGMQDLRLDVNSIEIAGYLKTFLDRMPGGFFIYSADRGEEIIYANAALLRMFQCADLKEFRKLTDNSFRGIVHPDDLERVEESIRQQIEGSSENLDYVEYRIISKSGEIRWVDDYGHFVHSQAGDIFYVFVVDVTEKKTRQMAETKKLLMENHLKELALRNQIDEQNQEIKFVNQEQLRRLEVIECLSIDYESIFYVDLDSNEIMAYRVSDRFSREFPKDRRVRIFAGFDTDYVAEWVYPEDRALLAGVSDPEYIRRKLAAEKNFYINYRIYKEGVPVYIQLRIMDVGGDGRVSQVVFGYRNIDREVKKEITQNQMLVEALQEANLANSAKARFLSNMSHDIRTPMNAIVGFTGLARSSIGNQEKAAEYLDMISASSDQLLQLLNDVLEISNIESAQIQLNLDRCSLIEVLQELQKSLLSRAAAKGISLSLDISCLRHDGVCADKHRLTQVLSYLTDNALKYTQENGSVTIEISEHEELTNGYITYQLAVEDSGIGISGEFLAQIFDPFEREKNTTLSGIHGTGLGLTIAKKLVDTMGGEISVVSTVGKGSRFTVSLPLLVMEEKAEDSKDAPSDPGQPRRVLVVDDNEINLEIETEILKDAGFLVDTAVDGSIALEKVKQSAHGEYDLILMDIQMPIMDGHSATRAIRRIQDPALSGIPIIAVSANAFEEDKKKSLESGMNAHLSKPLDLEQLFELINKFM